MSSGVKLFRDTATPAVTGAQRGGKTLPAVPALQRKAVGGGTGYQPVQRQAALETNDRLAQPIQNQSGPVAQLATYLTLGGKKITNVTFDKRPSAFRKAVYEYLGFDKGETPTGMNVCHKDPWQGFTARYKQELLGMTIEEAADHLSCGATQSEVEEALWAKCLDKFNDLDNVDLGASSLNKSMGSISRKAKNLIYKDMEGKVTYPLTVSKPKGVKVIINDSSELEQWAIEMGVDSSDTVEVDDIANDYRNAGCVIL